METINLTPFQFAPHPGRINFPGHTLTLIVKGTFDLVHDRTVTPSKEQLFPTGDEFFPDDVDMQGSCRYEPDFAFFKPKADLILSGHCHVPNGTPIPACRVKFQVGSHEKTLHVFGNRRWKGAMGFHTISDPEPFTKMELRYENSFGGEGYKKNPVGKGFSKQVTSEGKKVRFLPNIEDPEDIIGSPRHRPAPAGFGPLGKMWEQRFSKMGTYKGKYLKKRWPWFAEDFDYAYFNAAPPDMQVEGYLHGDEEVYFENLHPEHSRFISHLPKIRVRCFTNKKSNPTSNDPGFQEVSMKLDTLWADMDNEKLVLVWRGVTEVQTEEFQDILHAFIMSESLAAQPAPLEKCHEMFLATIAAEEETWAAEPEEPEERSEEPEVKPAKEKKPEKDKSEQPVPKEDLKKMIMAQTSAILAKVGIDVEGLPPEAREKAEKDQERFLDRLFETDPEKKMAMEQADQKAQMSEAFSKAGMDLDNLPPLTDKAKQEQLKLFAALGMSDPALMQSPEMTTLLGMMGAIMPKMGVDPENLDAFIEEAKTQQARLKKQLGLADEEETAEEEKPSVLTREIVQQRAAQNDSFEGEDFREIDLSDLDLKGINFSGANFSNVLLKDSNLSKAIFANAVLAGADLSNADMSDSILSGADLTHANLTGSILKKADLTRANLENVAMNGTDLSGARLMGAIVTGANLTKAGLKGADLSGANLKNTDMAGVDMPEANLTDAVLTEACLEESDLTGANLSGADLKKANLKQACLKEADFTDADLSEAVLQSASLKDTVFEKAKLHKTVLVEAEAVDANFSEADLTNAKMSNSDFSKADFSKSILNGADFRDSKLQDASVEGAKGVKANFNKADLTRLRASEACDFTESTFRESNGFESIWHDAVLKYTDFSLSGMQGADFTGACLQSSNLSGADMKHTRFRKADMRKARLLFTNLFEGSLEKADLTGADLSGSNMYGAEFLDAIIDHTKMENTNLKMTKLG
ncbi:MAG: DUF2169 domain-containing protein [Deltaproteobacteria bacterium]|nr:DUF2169 domain-containing protein [Deltaproteobacteria bacterium]